MANNETDSSVLETRLTELYQGMSKDDQQKVQRLITLIIDGDEKTKMLLDHYDRGQISAADLFRTI